MLQKCHRAEFPVLGLLLEMLTFREGITSYSFLVAFSAISPIDSAANLQYILLRSRLISEIALYFTKQLPFKFLFTYHLASHDRFI